MTDSLYSITLIVVLLLGIICIGLLFIIYQFIKLQQLQRRYKTGELEHKTQEPTSPTASLTQAQGQELRPVSPKEDIPFNAKRISKEELQKEVNERLKGAAPHYPDQELHCTNHPHIAAIGLCSICEQPFCANCLRNHDNLSFCPAHLELFLANKWAPVHTVKTNPNNPTKGVFLYEFKKKLWDAEKIPSYIQTQYKIQLEKDFIESHVVLFGREKDSVRLNSRLQNENPERFLASLQEDDDNHEEPDISL